jgi:hypothetical protein
VVTASSIRRRSDVAQHPVRLRLSGRGRLLVDDGMLGEAGDFPLRMLLYD